MVNPAPGGGTSEAVFLFTSETGAQVTEFDAGTSLDPLGTAVASTSVLTATASGVGTVIVALYESNPGGALSFTSSGSFMDVSLSYGNAFTSVSVDYCGLGGGSEVHWWDGSTWALVSPQVYDPLTGCVTMTLDDASSPTSPSCPAHPSPPRGLRSTCR